MTFLAAATTTHLDRALSVNLHHHGLTRRPFFILIVHPFTSATPIAPSHGVTAAAEARLPAQSVSNHRVLFARTRSPARTQQQRLCRLCRLANHLTQLAALHIHEVLQSTPS
jgi:hypothetical protein